MERSSGKRGTIAPKKGKKVGLKNTPSETDQNAKFCNRIGCSGRIKYGPNHYTQTGSSEKDKQPKSSSSSSNGNEELPGNSLRVKRSFPDSKRKTLSQLESDQLESIQSGDVDARELVTRHRFGSKNKTGEAKIWSSSNIHSQKVFHHKSELSSSKRTLNNNDISNSNSNSNGSNINNSSSSSSSSGGGRYCLRKLHSSSSSESKLNGKNEIKKENLEVESGSSLKVRRKAFTTGISGSGRSNFASGDSKNAGSVKTGRPVNTNNIRPRLNVGGPQISLNKSNSCSLSSGEQDVRSTRSPSNGAEVDLTRLMNIYNMGGITEVLLALNRMEEHGELTHEQALALESNFSPSPLNHHDQHGDMRLDIDNMSYEELIALGEMIGTVSTALSDETLLKCVKRNIYTAGPSEGVTGSGENGDGNKCSICQDEFVVGDDTGELVECQHEYHLTCINQWLQLKNWCPVCKTAAAPQISES